MDGIGQRGKLRELTMKVPVLQKHIVTFGTLQMMYSGFTGDRSETTYTLLHSVSRGWYLSCYIHHSKMKPHLSAQVLGAISEFK